MKCEYCGKEFDKDVEEDIFSSEMAWYQYENIRKCLCAECAINAIEDLDDGVYYEQCERCGRTFDFITENEEFKRITDGDVELTQVGPILCCNCARIDYE